MENKITYPIRFPLGWGESVIVNEPETLSRKMFEFVQKWGQTEFTFKDGRVEVKNDKFAEVQNENHDAVVRFYSDPQFKIKD